MTESAGSIAFVGVCGWTGTAREASLSVVDRRPVERPDA